MEKYIKLISPSGNFITYYHFSKHVHFSFTLQLDADGNVLTCTDVDKRFSEKGEFYVNDKPGDISKEEFDAARDKLIDFLKK